MTPEWRSSPTTKRAPRRCMQRVLRPGAPNRRSPSDADRDAVALELSQYADDRPIAHADLVLSLGENGTMLAQRAAARGSRRRVARDQSR